MTIDRAKFHNLVKGVAPKKPVENFVSGEPNLDTPIKTVVELASQRLKKLDPETIAELRIPKTERSLVTSAVRNLPDGSNEIVYILRTSDGSVFEMPEGNPYLQELQAVAANAAIDAMEMLSPIEAATAIKKAISEYGPEYQGGILDALRFAKEALQVCNEFQTEQLRSIQINVMQAATRQLQADQSRPVWEWVLLPPHRRHAASIVTEMALASAMESLISGDTVEAAMNMKEISKNMAERTAELQKIFVQNYRDMALGIAGETTRTAAGLVGEIISTGGKSASELAQIVLKILFGQKLGDEGVIKAILERSGDTGRKLLEIIERSGLTPNKFLQNLLTSWEKKNGETK